jgi:hypothetical protein
MYQEILRSIEGIGFFPAVSLVLFVAIFTAVVLRALRMDRAGADRLAAIPLDEPESTPIACQENVR